MNLFEKKISELLNSPAGRRLLVGLLRKNLDALKGTRFQFIRNHPMIKHGLNDIFPA